MLTIDLDARNWENMVDFCNDLLPALQAPEWHGMSPDALLETMIWIEGINGIQPPYVVQVSHLGSAPKAVQDGVIQLRDLLMDARKEFQAQEGHDVDVSMELLD